MTAAKLLTGHDAPVSNMEITLTNSYFAAKERFKVQLEKANRAKSGRRGKR